MLLQISDTEFLLALWSVGVLQGPIPTDVTRYLRFPAEAATSDVTSSFHIQKWEIETLVNLLFRIPKGSRNAEKARCRIQEFGTVASFVNLLRTIENSEYAAAADPDDIFLEMFRIGQRQFHWQRGFATTERVTRFSYIYGQGYAGELFASKYGFPINEFIKTGFFLFVYLANHPWAKRPDFSSMGVGSDAVDATLRLISRSLSEMETEQVLLASAQGSQPKRIAYMPSVLRKFPVIRHPEGQIICPLPELIMFRVTAGLYYDLCDGDQGVIAEANARFESYTRLLLSAFCPDLQVEKSQTYGSKKARAETPDVLVFKSCELLAAIECKATKLTFEAQFADNPVDAGSRAYDQLVRGVIQIWRFFRDCRVGRWAAGTKAPDAVGVLLTLETWMLAARTVQSQVIARARDLSSADPTIEEEDKCPIVFCSMQDLVDVLFTSSGEELIKAMQLAGTGKYQGWALREVRREMIEPQRRKEFPIRVESYVPWWKDVADEAARTNKP